MRGRLSFPFPRFAPAAAMVAAILVVPAAGSEPLLGGAAQSEGQGQAAGRGSSQTSQTTTQGQGTPRPTPGQAQGSPRPTPNAEQFLALGGEWWKDESIKKDMKLTDMQVRTISQIYDRRVREVTPYYNEFLKQLDELNRMTKERTVDESAYGVQVSRVEALRSKLNETRTVMNYAIYRRLDPAQYDKLREIWDQRRSGRGRGAPGPRTW